MKAQADFGLIGLAVMGQNLVLNINDKGYPVIVYNRTVATVDEFLKGAAKGRATITGAHSIAEFAAGLSRPRRIMLLVKAGDAVDQTIDQLLPHLEPGDCVLFKWAHQSIPDPAGDVHLVRGDDVIGIDLRTEEEARI